MLKKLGVIFGCMLLCCCTVWNKTMHSTYYNYENTDSTPVDMVGSTDYSQVDLGNAESFRVAMLLPLSGNVASMGQSMKNAATMAIGDLNNNNLVVQFYDTKGSTSGARVAIENAVNVDSDLILGPLTADEVSAISEVAKSKNIPVISFSTSPAVLQEGIYTLGLLNDQQIDRIVHYAVGQGRRQLAAVLPNNQSGLNMLKSYIKAARNNGAEVTKIGFYAPETMEFTDLVTSMIKDKDDSLGFDALLIPEYGNKLKAISSMFSYYDVAAPDVLFMGTSVWANTGLSKETELYGAVYPVMSLKQRNAFAQKYNELFGERPNGLSIFAYDAVALASSLSHKDKSYAEEQIVRPEGYYGMSGIFRILPNGQSEHGLDVVRVTSAGESLVESAPQKFYGGYSSYDGFNGSSISGSGSMPRIYGQSPVGLQNALNNL
ncbi:MAG: penicillin-binding protein activator [Alphaproteobacteria bacterium]|nr:penicillin-binding protein activator [Alphaproteobacteria bacterium]